MIFKYRRLKRLVNFQEWVLNNYINNKGYFNKKKLNSNQIINNSIKGYKFLLKKKNNLSTFWYYGLKFFLAKNFGQFNIKEQVDIFYNQNNYKWNQIFNIFKRNIPFLIKLINIFFIKLAWKNKTFLKKNFIKNFKLKFLSGFYNNLKGKNFFSQRYLTNKIYKTYLKYSKYRFNKFILIFIKNYYFQEFSKFRGFWTNYSLNLINFSYLNYIITSICNNLFKGKLFNKLFYNLKKSNKINLEKWNLFKYKSTIISKKIFKHKYINNYKKFFIYFKNNKINKNFLLNIRKFTQYYYFFLFNFFIWNNTIIQYKENTKFIFFRYKYLNIKLNNILNIISQPVLNMKFLKNESLLKFISINKFNKLSLVNLLNKFLYNKNELIYNNLKKLYIYNKKTYNYNKKILTWDKQKKFIYFNNKKWFTNYKDKIYNLLYKTYKTNYYTQNIYIYKQIYYNLIFKNYFDKNNNYIKVLYKYNQLNYFNKYKYYLYKIYNFNNKYKIKFNQQIININKNVNFIESKYTIPNYIFNTFSSIKKSFLPNKEFKVIFIKQLILHKKWLFNKNYFKLLNKFNKINKYYTNYNILYIKDINKLINKFW